MVQFFKRKKKSKEKPPPQLVDLDGNEISTGDEVISYRYELGKARVELDGLQYFYVSIESGTRVSYTKMIDAITGYQKVKKVTNG